MLSLRKLVKQTVDYAGLFPPAALPLEVVAKNFAMYLKSDSQSMLGRLVIPASRLSELKTAADSLATKSDPWRISALLPPWSSQDGLFAEAVDSINLFNQKSDRFVVDSIETKVNSTPSVESIVRGLPRSVTAFLEVGLGDGQLGTLSEIARGKEVVQKPGQVFAKIRTGRVVADQIPSVSEVARFIGDCSRVPVGFKATAGLHHPIRAEYRLTYEENPPCGVMHGFVNVFVAAVIAFEHQASDDVIEKILSETAISNFVFTDDGLNWNELAVPIDRIEHWRTHGIRSFGSCSFDEPTTELSI